jgi:hypothetical protein
VLIRRRDRNNIALNVTHGLVIDRPWVGLIADRKKTWKMRTRPTKVRGWIGLIEKGTGTVIGIACLLPALSRRAHNLHFKRHRVPPGSDGRKYHGKYLTPWVLTRSFRLPRLQLRAAHREERT